MNYFIVDYRVHSGWRGGERSIKPFVIGRKNWLFSCSVAGAQSSAALYSFVETCKFHQVDVYAWFAVLTHIREAKTLEQLEALLPFNIDPQALEKMRDIPSDLIFPDKSVVN